MSVIGKIRSFIGPRSIVTIAHQVSDKEHITAAWYVKSATEVHAIGKEMRKLFDTAEEDFKQKLLAVQAEAEKLAKNNKNKQGK